MKCVMYIAMQDEWSREAYYKLQTITQLNFHKHYVLLIILISQLNELAGLFALINDK